MKKITTKSRKSSARVISRRPKAKNKLRIRIVPLIIGVIILSLLVFGLLLWPRIMNTITPRQADISLTYPDTTYSPVIKTNVECVSGDYSGNEVTISWTNLTNSQVLNVDISTDQTWKSFYNKSVSGVSSINGPAGFSGFTGVQGSLTAKPNTTYYIRFYNGSAHFESGSFNLPTCGAGTIPTDSYRSEYWNSGNGASPVMPVTAAHVTGTNAEINFDWMEGIPVTGIYADHFITRWTGNISFPNTGYYYFNVMSDDGIRLFVDNQLVIDQWSTHAPQMFSGNKHLTAGKHQVRLEYYEDYGGAMVKMNYSQIPTNTFRGEYWNSGTGEKPNMPTGTPNFVKNDSRINFYWGPNSPSSQINADHFIAKWTGYYDFSTAGTYYFSATSDDGVRLYIDDKQVMDQWITQSAKTFVATVDLGTGTHKIVMDYYEDYGDASVILEWSTTQPTGITPAAITCKDVSYSSYVSTYGFYNRTSTVYSYTNPLSSANDAAFRTMQAKALKWAPYSNMDPVLVIWWTFFETGGKLDAWNFSNCKDSNYDINYNCPYTSSGAWQLGYGQQFATYPNMVTAFKNIYGDPNNAAITKAVGQNVYSKAGQAKTFPSVSMQSIYNSYSSTKSSTSRYQLSVLHRDQDISTYLLAKALYYDTHPPTGNFRTRAWSWSSYYQTNWQKMSNQLYDVVQKWNSICQ